jgi:flagellar motility protein MotE (MotC chaperone)
MSLRRGLASFRFTLAFSVFFVFYPAFTKITAMKTLLTAGFLMIVASSYSQIRVVYSKNENVIGYGVGGDATERYKKALKECADRKGTFCTEVAPIPGIVGQTPGESGCWAIVTARDELGNSLVKYDQYRNTTEEAVNNCKRVLLNSDAAVPSSITVFRSGCEKKPEAAPAAPAPPAAQWSGWTQAPCYKGLQYRVKSYEVFDLNRQYHYYFEVRNDYSKDVSFLFNLLDAAGKARFGDRHEVRKGQTVSFNHKMTSNYISSFQVQNMRAAYESKELPCDDASAEAAPDAAGNIDWHKEGKEMAFIEYEIRRQLERKESQDRSNQLMNLRAQARNIEKKFKEKYGSRTDLTDKMVNDYVQAELQKMLQPAAKQSAPSPAAPGSAAVKPTEITMQTSLEEDLAQLVDIYCKLGRTLSWKRKKCRRS